MKLTTEQQQEAAWSAWEARMTNGGNRFDHRDKIIWMSGFAENALNEVDSKVASINDIIEEMRG